MPRGPVTEVLDARGLYEVLRGAGILWSASAPVDRHPALTASLPAFTLHNLAVLLKDPYALPSLWNSLLLAGGTALLTVTFAATAAYALNRMRLPGRDGILHALPLLSSIVTGAAAKVPLVDLTSELHLVLSRAATAAGPDVFLFDEPLSSLDARLRLEARTFLMKLQRELATTTVFIGATP